MGRDREPVSRVTGQAVAALLVALAAACLLPACGREPAGGETVLNWYVFNEPSGAFVEAARVCSRASHGAWRVRVKLLPADASQQREQLVRRLAARDSDIDLIGMDVIWTAEFAAAGWILPWPESRAAAAREDRLQAAVTSASYDGRLWAAPFTTNTQLLWYRTDRVAQPPKTWDAMIGMAEALGPQGTIEVQGERYEGFTVFFVSLLASAGGRVLAPDAQTPALPEPPTHEALAIMRRLARSAAADPGLAHAREDQARLAFESGEASFMVNYTYVWPSANANAPEVARHMGWARWPAVDARHPSRVTIGGINLGVGAFTRYPQAAFAAAACIAGRDNQRLAAVRGGLPPTRASLYDTPEVRAAFPFADVLLATLRDAVQRPQTPLYNDVSLAISRTLHPMRDIRPDRDAARLQHNLEQALQSGGLL